MNWYSLGQTALKLIDAVFRQGPELVKEVFEELATELNTLNIPKEAASGASEEYD